MTTSELSLKAVKTKLRDLLFEDARKRNIIVMPCKKKSGKMGNDQPEGSLGDIVYQTEFLMGRINLKVQEDDVIFLAYMVGCYIFFKRDPREEMYQYCLELLDQPEREVIEGYLKEKLFDDKLELISWCEDQDENVFISSLYYDFK